MDKVNSRIAQAYGYTVCLICVIIILVSTHSVIDAAFDYANPRGSASVAGRDIASSYEVYRMQNRRVRPVGQAPDASSDTSLSETEMRKAFEAEKADAISSAKYRALRSLVSSIVFLVIASAFFLLHWRWIRRTRPDPLPG
jgi:hypothetical protein